MIKKLLINKKYAMFLSIFITLLFCMPSLTIIVKAGDTIIVDDDPGVGDYTTIQAAINAASNGDTIIVKDGTYNEQLTVDKSLIIAAASGETPTLYISSYDIGINVISPDVLIEGFEIYGNSSITGGPYPTIKASLGSDGLTITDNSFKVFTGQIGQMTLYVSSGVTDVTYSSNVEQDYEHSVYHAAFLRGKCYGSIQDAINIAVTDDIINVYPGIYDERLVIDRKILLIGNGNNTILQPTITPTAGVYDVEIDANGTVIQEFLFDFNGITDTRSGNGIVVSDLNDPPVVNVKINNNIIFTGHANTGIQTGKYSDVSGLDIFNNIFYADYDGLGEGIYINPFTGNDKVDIYNNEFYGNLYSAISVESSNVSIIDNVINSNYTNGVYGIRFIDLTGGQSFDQVNMENNIIENVTYGIRIGTTTDLGSSLSSTINGNTIINNDIGIRVLYGANLSNSIHNNHISKNSDYAINNEGNLLVNATNNWWGNISGPYNPISNPMGTGNNVSDNITFWPWYEFDGFSLPPSVNIFISSPKSDEDGTYVKSNTQFRLEAFDDESGINSLTYRIWNSTNRWSNWMNYTQYFRLIQNGKNIIQYNATDNAGTKTIDSSIHYVDDIDPTVEVIYPNGGEAIYGDLNIQWSATDKIIDQEQIKWNDSYALIEGNFPGHVQSFVPTEDRLNSIQLLLYGDDANVTIKLYGEIIPIPIPIAQSSLRIQNIGEPSEPEWVDFPFSSEIQLNINDTYYIGVTQDNYGSTGFKWFLFNSSGGNDPYDYGNGWLKNIDSLDENLDWDWCFKTMYWNGDLGIQIQYGHSDTPSWITIAEHEENDGSFIFGTTLIPDDIDYKIKVIAYDGIGNANYDISDEDFIIDNTGPTISDVEIFDSTIGSSNYTKNGDEIEISATISGNPVSVVADLSVFGYNSNTTPTSQTGSTYKWLIPDIECIPSDGLLTIDIMAYDATGDNGYNRCQIIADNAAPTIEITRPMPAIYFWDSQPLLPYAYPVVFGPITIKSIADDEGSGIEKVEFYRTYHLTRDLMEIVYDIPYDWLWDEASWGFFKIEVIAYDLVGHNTSAITNDIFLINFGIF